MKKTITTLAALSMAALMTVPAFGADTPDYRALENAAERLEDYIDDMEDARSAAEKEALQNAINAIIDANEEFASLKADYTSMTKAQLEAAEDAVDRLEDQFKKARKAAEKEQKAAEKEQKAAEKTNAELPDRAVKNDKNTATDATPIKRADIASLERLEDLIDDMEDASADKKTAIQAEIDALTDTTPLLAQFAADYTVMTKAQLEAAEDAVDKLKDQLEAQLKNVGNGQHHSNNEHGNHHNQANPNNNAQNKELPEGAVNMAPLRPAHGNNLLSLKNASDKLEDLIDLMEDAAEADKADIQAKIDALIKEYPALGQFAADYTAMTKAQLEAAEDAVDKFEDAVENAIKEAGVPAEKIVPQPKTREEIIASLEDLLNNLKKAETDEEFYSLLNKNCPAPFWRGHSMFHN